MSATFNQVESAIQAVWDSGWTGSANVAGSNVTFDPAALPSGSYYLETETNSGPQNILSLDDAYTGTPTFTVTVHTQMGIGKSFAVQVLDMAAALYRGVQLSAGTSTLRAYSFSKPMPVPKEGWFTLSMQISFRIF